MMEGLIIAGIMAVIGVMAFIEEGVNPFRRRQAHPELSQPKGDPLDAFWAEDVAATDELITKIEAELNREHWDRLPPNVQQLVLHKPKRTPVYHGPKPVQKVVVRSHGGSSNVCEWGRYHDPEFERCECWDPGQ